MLKAQICFSVILILYVFSENTLKLFYRGLRLRQKSLGAHGDYANFTLVLF
jgi:hypothetical protein